MKAKSEQPLSSELLAAYLDGEVTAHEATRIEQALEACSTNRRHLEELRRIRDALAAAAPEVEDLDLVAAVRNKARSLAPGRLQTSSLPLGRARARSRTFGVVAAVAGIAAVSLGIAVSPEHLLSAPDSAELGRALERSAEFGRALERSAEFGRAPERSKEFRAKGASSAAVHERWTGIRIYRVVDKQAPERVTESLRRHDTLLFSYTNLGPDPFEYLMIFAIGADQRVHWFYPAYEAASENPLSTDIEAGEAMLADAVEHDYSEGDLEVYALFSHQPERVSKIEAWLRQRAEPLDAAPLPGASLHRVSLRVRP